MTHAGMVCGEASGREMGGFLLDGYDPEGFYCELLRSADNELLRDRLAAMPTADFKRRVVGAEQALYNLGITFTVYSDSNATDRILPFDAIPRVLSAAEWTHIEQGVVQRVTAAGAVVAWGPSAAAAAVLRSMLR